MINYLTTKNRLLVAMLAFILPFSFARAEVKEDGKNSSQGWCDGVLYKSGVLGMDSWEYAHLKSHVRMAWYGARVNVNLLGLFHKTANSRWDLAVTTVNLEVGRDEIKLGDVKITDWEDGSTFSGEALN